MANLDSNTSLKMALSEIEKKVSQSEIDRNTLESILQTKGVEVVTGSKMETLINHIIEINQIPDIAFLEDWIVIDNDSTKALDCNSTNAIFDGEKMHIMLATSYSSGTSYSNGKHITYEPKTNVYLEEKNPPVNYAGTCTALLNTEQKKSIFVFGGQVWTNYNGWTYYRENREYDILTKTWTNRNNHKNDIAYKAATVDNENRILFGYDFEYDIDLSTYTDISIFKNYYSSQLVHIGSNTIYSLEFLNDSTSKNMYIVCYDTLLKTRTIECTIDIGINYRPTVLGRACFYYDNGFLYICVNKQVIKYSIETMTYSIINEYSKTDTFQGIFFNYKKTMFAKFKELKCLIKY